MYSINISSFSSTIFLALSNTDLKITELMSKHTKTIYLNNIFEVHLS